MITSTFGRDAEGIHVAAHAFCVGVKRTADTLLKLIGKNAKDFPTCRISLDGTLAKGFAV